jgi:hypothetical protein
MLSRLSLGVEGGEMATSLSAASAPISSRREREVFRVNHSARLVQFLNHEDLTPL